MSGTLTFQDLEQRWDIKANVYQGAQDEIQEKDFETALKNLSYSGNLLVTRVANAASSKNQLEMTELAKLALKAKCYSDLQKNVVETNLLFQQGLKDLKPPLTVEKLEEYKGMMKRVEADEDSKVANAFAGHIENYRTLEERAEKLTFAEKELAILLPKLDVAFKSFEKGYTWSFYSLFSFPFAKQPDSLLVRGEIEIQNLAQLLEVFKEQLINTKDKETLAHYLRGLALQLTEVADRLNPSEDNSNNSTETVEGKDGDDHSNSSENSANNYTETAEGDKEAVNN